MSGLWSTTHCDTAHPIAKISEVKDRAPILVISVFRLSSLHFLSKTFNQSFCYTFFLLTAVQFIHSFISSTLMRCSYSIISSKSRCRSRTFSNVLFYIAANTECLTKRQMIFRCANSAFPRLYCVKFSFMLVNISRSYG